MTEVRELDSSPRMRVLYPRAALGAARSALGRIPGRSLVARVPLIPASTGHPRLPDSELRLAGVEIDRERLAEYDRVCGFRLRDTLPPTYPHILAFPLSMEIMTSREFPFPVIGMVHLRNRIQQRRPVGAGESLDLRVWTEDLRPHDKGSQFEIRAVAAVAGEPAWESWSTYLYRHSTGERNGGGRRRSDGGEQPPRAQAKWRIPGDIGRAYAGVSGDGNPIHMHPLSARLFGMPRAIAHGMWLKARCLAALEGHLPDALEADVSFKLPVLIPTTVSFASWADGAGRGRGRPRGFALHDRRNEKPHLTGSVRPL
jgi:acyl dehydratase